MKRRLEIGPGEHPLGGFDRLDCLPRPDVTYVALWGKAPLPIEHDHYDFVYASHVLEHVPWNSMDKALAEVVRILRPGAVFEVWVPDFAYVIEAYRKRRCGDDWRRDNPNSDPMRWVNGRIFAHGPGEENWHRTCFDKPYLKQCLEQAGFVDVTYIAKRTHGVSHGRIDLGMQGLKP